MSCLPLIAHPRTELRGPTQASHQPVQELSRLMRQMQTVKQRSHVSCLIMKEACSPEGTGPRILNHTRAKPLPPRSAGHSPNRSTYSAQRSRTHTAPLNVIGHWNSSYLRGLYGRDKFNNFQISRTKLHDRREESVIVEWVRCRGIQSHYCYYMHHG